jgi:hypothetical protein
MSEEMVQREVDGELFEFPAHNLNEFEFWFGNDTKPGMYTVKDGKVATKADTGLCGSDAIAMKHVSLIVFMQNKCNALHLGHTEAKRKELLFGGKRRGRPRKDEKK